MKRIDQVISEALKLCEPQSKDSIKLQKVAQHVTDLTDKSIRIIADDRILGLSIGGSYAKGTWLAEDNDLDFFVKIDPSVDKDEFEQLGTRIGFSALSKYRPYLRYSDHPYVEAKIQKIRINIVPCYQVNKGQWKSAADRSPFHTIFMTKNLDESMKGQVRILKKFLKSIGIYGSQLSVGGFSGYVTEILILNYRSFIQAISLMANISHDKHVIALNEPDPQYRPLFNSKIIIIDPIDPRRNLGAAISAESLGKFILAARSLLQNPSIGYFKTTENKFDIRVLEKVKPNLLMVEFKIRKRSPDIIWGQLKRSLTALSKQLSISGFNAFGSTCITDENEYAAFVFLIEFTTLPSFTLNVGPEVFRKHDTERFIEKKMNKLIPFWINGNMRVVTISERNNLSAKEYLSELLLGNATNVGINKDIIEDLRRGFDVYRGTERKLNRFIKSALSRLILNDGRIIKFQRD
ncbi:MAG: CCA tRNA nucleotidyltransferase [Thermoproteota archaeon]|nr:CCA tRNA nucleotidyltransferase [Thermoproteota archaeon]